MSWMTAVVSSLDFAFFVYAGMLIVPPTERGKLVDRIMAVGLF